MKYIPADQIFYEIRQALAVHNCSHLPSLESHAINCRTFIDLVREDDMDSMLRAFVTHNSYYYGVLFQKNYLYKNLSEEVAMMLLKKRHEIETEALNKHFKSN